MSPAQSPIAGLLVELHNHAHLAVLHGHDFTADAMRMLQWRAHLWGGSVTELGPSRFLVTLPPDVAAKPVMPPHDSASRIERWQVEMAATPLVSDTHDARPVVTVDPVRYGGLGGIGSGYHYPEQLERSDASVPTLSAPQFGWRWRMDYERDMALAVAFGKALVQERVNLAFQPVVRYDQPQVALYSEGLLRVFGLPGGEGAGQVTPVLERLGLIRALDRLVVLAVLDQLERHDEWRLGCNVSACSLVADVWWASTFDRLAARPEVAARLTIEITETAPIPDFDIAVAFVERLKTLGCQIALDDFGSGHSSLAFARATRPQIIKLDAYCLRDARDRDAGLRTFRHLVALCQTLATHVVAEGVEQTDDVRIAFEAGVDWLQGVALAPPVPCSPPVTLLDVVPEADA
ncbi:EAL domain-containing protein [Paraburkholderia ferrariae]|uniref:EAL domain-containing protein n=1 Tax=Paraburkholderia ferrariae TaxID=386056 RepID=UPI000694007D|nr:EAL domain-containing protein [Paraburkholderia ferrariae]